MAAALLKGEMAALLQPSLRGLENGYGDHSIAPPGPRRPIHWPSGLAAAEARRLRRPHCYIMGMSGTDIPRSGPGKGQTRVRSLPKPTSMVQMNCD